MYSITREKIGLEKIQKAIGSFDRQGKWKKSMNEKFGTVFYDDSFQRYSSAFSEIFGLRSDRALYLFSQTVGVKVLGNLNEFVRLHMFEAQNTEDEFAKLVRNYSDLRESYNEIEKVQEQLQLLKDIIDAGAVWEAQVQKKKKLENFRSTIPLWFSHNAINFIKQTLNVLNIDKNAAEDAQNIVRNDTKKINDEFLSLHAALNASSASIRLSDIENNIKLEELNVQNRKNELAKYERYAAQLGLDIPKTEKTFISNLNALEELGKQLENDGAEIQKESLQVYSAFEKYILEQNEIRSELESLSKRSTNIPAHNVHIRDELCSGISCSQNDLLFAGELLCVANTEQYWEDAIEKVLHNFALCILVPEHLYKKVNTYVAANNMRGRIVYFKTDTRPLIKNIAYTAGTLPSKLIIKKQHALSAWLESYLESNFNYICTDDQNMFVQAAMALTSSGLIKTKLRHEKDDRSQYMGKQFFVLGWDNFQKRTELSTQLSKIQKKILELQNTINATEKKRKDVQENIAAVKALCELQPWDAVDVKKYACLIDTLLNEKAQLLGQDKNLQQLQARISELEKDLHKKENEYTKLTSDAARINQRIEDLEKKKSTIEPVLQGYYSQIEEAELILRLNDFSEYFNTEHIYADFGAIESERDTVIKKLNSEYSTAETDTERLADALLRKMIALKHPKKEIAEKYPSWASDMTNFEAAAESLSDFRDFYTRLSEDDLPRHLQKFKSFFNSQMLRDITNFNTIIYNGEQMITAGIDELNRSLRTIPYNTNPPTYIKLENRSNSDIQIKEMQAVLRQAMPDAAAIFNKDENAEINSFKKIERFIQYLQENDGRRKKVLDVRNWFVFGAMEYYQNNNSQKQYYEDSASLSGGEKAKLAYTILASAIAFQFGITGDSPDHSFRFVIIDEAFSKIDPENSRYAMELFKQMGLQLMVVTPMDKINIVENYVSTVHITENVEKNTSHLLEMKIERFKQGF